MFISGEWYLETNVWVLGEFLRLLLLLSSPEDEAKDVCMYVHSTQIDTEMKL